MTEAGNYNPATFGWRIGPFVPYTYHGVAFPQGINPRPSVRTLLDAMLDALVPHIPGGLVRGQCWGGDTRDRDPESFHLYGIAVDLNAPENPQTGGPHTFGGPHVLPADTQAIVAPFGWQWGGSWTRATPTDYMHIELQVTPERADSLAGNLGRVPGADGAAPLPVHEAATRTLQRGDVGTDVRDLQRVLNAWYPNRPALALDGIYGPLTEAAVKYFQGRDNITVDGITGPVTWRGLGFTVHY